MAEKPNEQAVLAFLEACADWAMQNPDKLQAVIAEPTKAEDATKAHAKYLVNQTVGDLQSSLGCNEYSIDELMLAQKMANRRKVVSKVRILKTAIRKAERK